MNDGTLTVLDQVHDPAARGIGLHPGMAYPLRPPFGAAVVAWSAPDAVEAWLDHVSPERRDHYREALAAIREPARLELAPAPLAGYRRLLAELDENLPRSLGDGRSVDELFEQLADLAERENYLATDVDGERLYPVNDLNARHRPGRAGDPRAGGDRVHEAATGHGGAGHRRAVVDGGW